MKQIWLVDFDDTLAAGPMTWGYTRALPRLIQEHGLPVEGATLEQSILRAQQRANQSNDLMSIVAELFGAMRWPQALVPALLLEVERHYQPELFDDTTAFLEALNQAGHTIMVLSNNPHTPDSVAALGLGDLVHDALTPHMFPERSAKPERALWDQMLTRFPALTTDNTVVVGDDPWSDVAFAQACGLRAWLVDRHDRFASMKLASQTRRVRSLAEIALP